MLFLSESVVLEKLGINNKVKKVETIPIVEQGLFPALPVIKPEAILIISESDWGSSEREWAAGTLITACCHKGEWHAVPTTVFGNLIFGSPFGLSQETIVKALWSFAEDGLVDIIEVDEAQYVIPSPEMVRVSLTGSQNLFIQ